jgi:hypothetical protein
MNIRDRQYAVANKIPYKQLKQQKQLNKATIEGNEDKPAFMRPAEKITGFAASGRVNVRSCLTI